MILWNRDIFWDYYHTVTTLVMDVCHRKPSGLWTHNMSAIWAANKLPLCQNSDRGRRNIQRQPLACKKPKKNVEKIKSVTAFYQCLSVLWKSRRAHFLLQLSDLKILTMQPLMRTWNCSFCTEKYLNLLKLFALIYCVGYFYFHCAFLFLWVCKNKQKIKLKVFWGNVILLKRIS